MRLLPEDRVKRGRLTLLAIALVFALPIVVAWAAYLLHWSPGKTSNYGDLIKPRPVPNMPLQALGGGSFRFDQLRGKWVMIAFGPSACDASCVRKLYYMRQIRVAEGPDMERVERVWVLTDRGTPSAQLLAAYRGMHVLYLVNPAFERAFPARISAQHHLYLIDPLGNVMMRFPRDPDPARILKDLTLLLRYSSAG